MFLWLFERAIQFFFASSVFPTQEVAQVSLPATVGPHTTLYAVNEFISPDGFPRSASLINSVFPAPAIIATKGDTFKLNVANDLSDVTMLRSTSIHWHGILQRGTNWADGPVGVSQCPISPGRSFLYEFNATQGGTFWYHSHYGTQYCDGMRGALVVYDPEDPHKTLYDVDDETTILTLGDWYHYPSPSILKPNEDFPKFDSNLINGKGRYSADKLADLSVINVEYGKRYRFRIVSISCDPWYTFSIDGHSLTVIEADGEAVVPVRQIDAVKIFAGQRYSVVLVANQPVGNYWIRSPPEGETTFVDGIDSAILRYKGAKEIDPSTTHPKEPKVLLETQLHALIDPEAPGKPNKDGGDINLNLNYAMDQTKRIFTINNKTFVPPTVPVLLQILTGTSPFELLPEGSVYVLPRNQSVSVSFTGDADITDGPHPFHLHGHSFSVVRSTGPEHYNYRDPVRRDTVNTGTKDDAVTIRFRTDNPGPWILHCHIDWHLERGMAIVFAEDPGNTPKVVRPPEEWHYLCPIFDNLPASLTTISTVEIPTPKPTLEVPTPEPTPELTPEPTPTPEPTD